MPKSKDLFLRLAYKVIKQHGLGAESHALSKIVKYLDKKKLKSAQNWLMILKWIKEIQNVIPRDDVTLIGHRPRKTKTELIFTRSNLLALITEYQKETKLSILGWEKEAGLPQDALRDFIRGKAHLMRPDRLEKALLVMGYKMSLVKF